MWYIKREQFDLTWCSVSVLFIGVYPFKATPCGFSIIIYVNILLVMKRAAPPSLTQKARLAWCRTILLCLPDLHPLARSCPVKVITIAHKQPQPDIISLQAVKFPEPRGLKADPVTNTQPLTDLFLFSFFVYEKE